MQKSEIKSDLTHSVRALIMSDIEYIKRCFDAGILSSLESKSLGRKNFDDVSEMLISVASTASLIGYRLEGDEWRLDAVREGTRQASAIVSALDGLRDSMIDHKKDICAALTKRRFLSAAASKGVAIAVVALDAACDRDKPVLFSVAGIRQRSNDPVGDAQCIAEGLELAGEIPGKKSVSHKATASSQPTLFAGGA